MPAAEAFSRVPPLTQEKLRTDHPEGTRHKAKLDLALSLIGNGLSPDDVASLLRVHFPAAAEREIEGVVEWVLARNPGPSGGDDYHASGAHQTHQRKPSDFMRGRFKAPFETPKPQGPPPEGAALRALRDWMGEVLASEDDLVYASPVKPSSELAGDASLLAEHLYAKSDLLNVVCAYTQSTTLEGKRKANPHGPGKTLSVRDWLDWFGQYGVPVMKAGAWVRPNPVAAKDGSGKAGAFMDKDIAVPRFLLLESDCLPLRYQLTAMAVFRLPIACIMTSGGASYHAWVKLDCDNLAQFEHAAERILAAVEPFGFDAANKNPSRLSRLPGVMRGIRHGEGDGRQRLVYLNPEPQWRAIL